MFARQPLLRAVAASVLPMLAIGVLGFLMYSAGADPAEPKDKYQAWYIGIAVLVSGALIVMIAKSTRSRRENAGLNSSTARAARTSALELPP
jgi:uncharacterized membrane protein YiaA